VVGNGRGGVLGRVLGWVGSRELVNSLLFIGKKSDATRVVFRRLRRPFPTLVLSLSL
jgi:hypothetical protein